MVVAAKKQWSQLSTSRKAGIVAVGVAELVVTGVAMRDLVRRPASIVPARERETLHRVVQAAFRQRRKQIHNSLVRELPVDRGTVDRALAACSVTPDRRPQTLTLPEWACLTTALGPHLAAGA